MNHVFTLVWNAAMGCWNVTHEHSKRRRKNTRRVRKLALSSLLLPLLFSSTAQATCSTAGSTVTCTGVPSLPLFLNNFSSATTGLTVNINSGAQMNATLGGHVLDLTGVNISLNNSGTIDPALLGLVSVLSGGAFIGTGATSTVSVLNNASGIIRGTGMLLGLNLTSIDGLGIAVNNAAAGTTSLTNNGTITSTGLSIGGITLADTPVVGVYGGSQVNMTNSSTGVINGRIAFETSAAGNTFTNAGAITGGVSLGAGSTNTFTAMTGSTVNVGDGVQVSVGLGGLIGLNLTFAPTGTVDGGAGGVNSLILQNPIGVGGGTTGTGTASSATYVNFSNLTINSGTWTLQGPLVSGATTLNGGVAQFNNNATFGSGVLTSNGGILQASNAGLNVSNLIALGAGGVTVQGSNATTLSGVISGSGGLTKIGAGQLNLSAANTYLGNTNFSGGTVQLGNNQALSTGTIYVFGATSLLAPGIITLNNAINLNANLTAGGANALTLGGVLSGGNGLIKTGASSLTLNGANTYTGTTALNAGTLIVGSDSALGTGSLNASNGTTLDANTAVDLANNVNLGGNLTLGGTNALTLDGMVAGIGGLIKNGAADLALNGANVYLGNTTLNTGKLTVGSNTALGSGTLNAADNTTLDANKAVSLNNAVALNGALNVGGTADLILTGLVSGAGSLVKNGAANLILNGANNYLDGTTLNAGTLTVVNSLALGSGALTVGGAATVDSESPSVALNNAIALNAALTVGGTQNLTLTGATSGTGPLIKNGAAKLTLNGNNTFSGGTTLNAGTLTLGNANSMGSGALIVGGAATLDNGAAFGNGNAITLNAGLSVAGNNDLSLNGVIDGAGSLTKNGLADLTLAGNNSFTGALNIVSGSVTTLNTQALGNTAGVNISAGAGLNLGSDASAAALAGSGSVQLTGSNTLTVGGVSSTSTFDGDLGGSGGVTKVGTGTLYLTGINGVTGNTTINGGTLDLSGSLGSAQINVNTGASFTGTGAALGTLNINNGGHLALSSGNTMSAGELVLGAGSNVDMSLASPSTTSLMNVGGNLTLNGNLNVTDAGGFGVGVYRMFNYTGALTNLGLDVASVPVGYGLGDLVVQTSIANQVNLQVSAPNVTIRYWDGSQTIPNGTVDGGSGTWSAGGTNWTNANGLLNQTWASDFAVFQGSAGTVAVNGTQVFTGLQFITDGYNLVNGTAGQLTAINGTGGTTAVRVDPGVTGTVGVNIDGSGILHKLDSGTLVLNGANTYTGGTQLDGGKIVVGSNTALGSGVLTANAGTQLDSNSAVTLGNAATLNGYLTVLGSNALTLNGGIGGTGGLIKNGAANLTLGGNNTFLGDVALNAGGLTLASDAALGAASLNAAGGTNLDAATAVAVSNAVNLAGNLSVGGTADLTLNGAVNGAGSLTKNGAGDLAMNGSNNFLGGVALNAGTLTVGSNSAIGLGNLTVAGASTLDSNSALNLGNNLLLNASLSNGGSNDLTLGGVLSGAGALVKDGGANLTLNGINTYQGGTALNAGTLTLGSGAALGSGTLTAAGNATLDTVAPMVLANNISIDANLNLAGAHDLTLGGVIDGAGTLSKNGLADLTLAGNNTFSGTVDVLSGSLITLGSTALGNNASVQLASGAVLNLGASTSLASLTGSGAASIGTGDSLSIGGSNLGSTFDGAIVGTGELNKLGTGTLTLSGSNSLTGDTTVEAGTLRVNGSLGSSHLQVNSGATLSGNGSLGGAVTVADGGHLALATGNTLSAGSLALGADSQLDVALGAPSNTSLLNVGGNLTLDGKLNISDAGGFGTGVYRLINYTGNLTDQGLDVASAPLGSSLGDLVLQTGVANQINLVSAPNDSIRFWDGSQTAGNGSVDGGTGTWTAAGTNWTSLNGTINRTWAGDFAVFQGSAGTVTVDGTQLFSGLQFVTDGYNLVHGAAGQLTAVNGSSGTTAVRVDPGVTATVGVDINGSGTLDKLDSGTLVLTGANTYTGGTQLHGGKIVVGSNTALGSGVLTASASTQLDSNSALALGNGISLDGDLTVGGSNALTLNGAIGGTGGLIKTGATDLTLGGNNAFLGDVALNAGGLILASNPALGAGTLNAAGGTRLDASTAVTVNNAVNLAGNLGVGGTADLTLNGVVNGAGSLTKNGAANLTLDGLNTYQGGTALNAGTLTLGSDGALGSGALTVAGNATLDSVAPLVVANNVSVDANLNLAGTHDLTLAGVMSGAGELNKLGTGTLTLNGSNSLTGDTTVEAGTLRVNGSLGSSHLQVNSGATLSGNGSLGGAVTVADGGHLALATGNTLSAGSLALGADSQLDVALAAPSNTSLLNVGGNLTLDGKLNISDAGGFGTGVYRLINYTGNLTDQGLDVASAPLGSSLGDLAVQTGVANQINLVSAPNDSIRFWDGSQTAGNGSVDGGTGTWTAAGTNWTSLNGTINRTWAGDFAVFQGSAGTVTVDGTQLFSGLQFVTDGYNLIDGAAGQLTAVNGSSGTTAVRVDPGVTATVGVDINGSGTLDKLDSGTLVLTGANTYSGGTQLHGGQIVVGSNTALGNGVLTASAGTQLDSNSAIALGNAISLDGDLTVGGSHALTLNGAIGGSGGLIKTGAADLTLGGTNTLTGDIEVRGGSLSATSSTALGNSAAVNIGGGTRLNLGASISVASLTGNGTALIGAGNTLSVGGSNQTSTFAGVFDGLGHLNKQGSGNLTLSGANSLRGDSSINGGTLKVIGSLDSANIAVNNGGTLTGSGSLTGAVAVADGGHLVGTTGNTLTMDSLVMSGNSSVDAGLGNQGSAGANPLFSVGTDLTLDGKLNITDAGGFGSGVYRLFNYGGSLTDNGLQIGSTPIGLTQQLRVQTAVGHQINLLVSAADTHVQFWNGSHLAGNGTINGGDGSWSRGTSNWTDVDGIANNAWADSFAVFQGAAGTVTVNGSQSATGMQFVTDGYSLVNGTAGSLTAVNGATGNMAVRVDPNATATIGVAINGSGALGKYDQGTLVLNAANSYTGGTQLHGGTLVLGNGSALGTGTLTAADGTTLDNSTEIALNNAVELNGSLTLAGSHDLALAGVISGDGDLIKQGSSDLVLSADNVFSGALNILGGNLALEGANALGRATLNIADAASVSLGGQTTLSALSGTGDLSLAAGSQLTVGSNNAPSTYDGNLSGPGSLIKTGLGKLVLNGRSIVGGGTFVEAGSLIIGGAAGSTASLASNVQVDSGAMLGGHGNIFGNVNLANGAILNPGNSIGTLRVNGDLNLNAGSTLVIEANPDGSSDKVLSTGTVSLNGAHLSVLAGAGTWAPSSRYGIIQAAALNGTFADVTSNLAFLTPQVAYSTTGAELVLQRNDVSFASLGETGNQRAAAAAVEATGGTLGNAVAGLSAAQARAAYDSLSGEIHASTHGAMFDDSRYVRETISQRLRAAQDKSSAEGVLHRDAESDITFWVQGYGGWGDNSGNSNAASIDHNSTGTLLGVDLPVGDAWRVGVAAGYGSNDLDVNARNASSDIDSTSLQLYAAGQWDAINLRVGASHVWNDIDSRRHVNFDGVADYDKASYEAKTTQVFGELGYDVKVSDFILEPFVGLARVNVDSDSFGEHGGVSALQGASQDDSVTYSTLGMHASTPLATVAGVPLALQGTVGWQHAFDDLDPSRQMAFAGGQGFTVQGAPLAQDTGVAQLGLQALVAPSTTVSLGYSGQFGDGYKDSGVRLGLNVSF
ncbi:autotransporter-associated beta strand repeat-containing protein [Pseudomonas sp. PDM31]|uniref:autotransporter-associated beta strand repeat-containing protein n=1 Tax=Pseudomonas sp. PDM31 TaxID=2854778 RepID=UPI001C46B14A|nr:autotransporter-associated beta strand repeat-containing protein [Pseudomonas sp. PDM31]MBV7478306.1 autotransporter-associated beta strand repeat-containing protein [Pseudomonas sp. PDM31]